MAMPRTYQFTHLDGWSKIKHSVEYIDAMKPYDIKNIKSYL